MMHILYLSAPGGGLDTNVRVLAPLLAQAWQDADDEATFAMMMDAPADRAVAEFIGNRFTAETRRTRRKK